MMVFLIDSYRQKVPYIEGGREREIVGVLPSFVLKKGHFEWNISGMWWDLMEQELACASYVY
ncbi:hypothetical protein AMTR_s00004p00159080 [Amborella trichopoda]|uniref:Uncharacterized protein n=1 Tax=Amborella trichopoda TaxID=13333 RepID=W1NE58_AMBTC|nr:hypothetical protein AMTR_s00004p00159080 [Amborella trichopoda]